MNVRELIDTFFVNFEKNKKQGFSFFQMIINSYAGIKLSLLIWNHNTILEMVLTTTTDAAKVKPIDCALYVCTNLRNRIFTVPKLNNYFKV